MSDEQRFVLGIAYQAGPSPLIKQGADRKRDIFDPNALEKAAWGFIGSDMLVGAEHIDGTETAGLAKVVESYIYRGPDWTITDVLGQEVIVKSGDWLLGAVLDDIAWGLYKSGRISGWSPQGSARRRPVGTSLTKSSVVVAAERTLAHLDEQRAVLVTIIERNTP